LRGLTHVAARTLAYASGDLATALVTAALTVNHLLSKHYRLYRLYYCHGRIVANQGGIAHAAKATAAVGRKRPKIPFSTVKNYVLFERGNANKALTSANSKTTFTRYFNVVSYGNAIKSAVEWDRIDAYACGNKLGVLDSDAGCCGNYSLTLVIEIYPCVFKAISVTAGIEHSFGVYAHGASSILKSTA
jgi:hypothetical protein